MVALLLDRRLRRRFVMAATHLHWDPRWPDVKLLQVRSCITLGSTPPELLNFEVVAAAIIVFLYKRCRL